MSHPLAPNQRFRRAPSVKSDIGTPGKMFGREDPSCKVVILVPGYFGFGDRRPRIARWCRECPMERLRFEGSTKSADIKARLRVG